MTILENLKKDNRLATALVFSCIVHMLLMVVFYLMMVPASGLPEGDVVSVSLDTSTEEAQSGQVSESTESPQEFTPQEVENFEEIQEQLEQALEEYQYDVGEEYLEKQQQLLQQKQNMLQALREKGENIAKNIAERKKYGTLAPGTFYGVKIIAKNVILVLDISGSMNIYEAKVELKNGYTALTPSENFNLIMYSESASVWQETLVSATDENKALADKWLHSITSRGSTNIHDALHKALEQADRSKVEVIYFLTDGIPSSGPVIQPLKLLALTKVWNKGRVIINTIGLGPHQDKVFLEKLAAENGGIYYRR